MTSFESLVETLVKFFISLCGKSRATEHKNFLKTEAVILVMKEEELDVITSDGQTSKGSELVLGLDNCPGALMHVQSLRGPPGPVNIGMEILQEQLSQEAFLFQYFGQVFSCHAGDTTKKK